MNRDRWDLLQDEYKASLEEYSKENPQPLQSEDEGFISVLYEDADGREYGLLDIDLLRKMEEFENTISDHKNWTTLCLAESLFDRTCQEPDLLNQKYGAMQSPLWLFEGLDLSTATQ